MEESIFVAGGGVRAKMLSVRRTNERKLILARQQNQLFLPFQLHSHIPRERLFFHAPSSPVWISWLGWDNFPAVPCSAVSPLEAFAQQLTATPAAGIWLQQTADYRPALEHAARKGFKGLTDGDLKTLAKERELDVAGSDSQPTSKTTCIFSQS